MDAPTTKARIALTHQARIPVYLRHPSNQQRTSPITSNALSRFRNAVTKGRATTAKLQEDNLGVETGASKAGKLAVTLDDVRAWLEKAQQVVSERADKIETHDEKKAFEELAILIKGAIPGPNAEEYDVPRSLSLLKQRIAPTKEDTDRLKDVKNYLIGQVTELIG